MYVAELLKTSDLGIYRYNHLSYFIYDLHIETYHTHVDAYQQALKWSILKQFSKLNQNFFKTHKIHEDIDQKNLFHLLDCVSTWSVHWHYTHIMHILYPSSYASAQIDAICKQFCPINKKKNIVGNKTSWKF